MSDKFYFAFNKIIIFITFFLAGFVMIVTLTGSQNFNILEKSAFFIPSEIILATAMFYKIKTCNEVDKKEYFRQDGLYATFVVYVLFLFIVLFCRYKPNYDIGVFSDIHYNLAVNLIPFESIKLYFENYNYLSLSFFVNIIGNICIFMPLGFFGGYVFEDKFKNGFWFILFVGILISIIEFMQFVLFVGSADVDDVILNTLGAGVVYLLVKNKKVKSFIDRILE